MRLRGAQTVWQTLTTLVIALQTFKHALIPEINRCTINAALGTPRLFHEIFSDLCRE